MTTKTSRTLRGLGLTLFAVGAGSVLAGMVLSASVGKNWAGYVITYGSFGFWLGIALYLIGRFQFRP